MRFSTFTLLGMTSIFATASIVESLAIQGGALAILGWAVWYLLTRALPRERKIFLAEQHKTRAAFCRSLRLLSQSFQSLAIAITGQSIPVEDTTAEEEEEGDA